MKRFKLRGNTAYWNGLRLTALNLNTLREEETSPIPNGKRMHVVVVNNLHEVKDARKEVLSGEISDTDKAAILDKIKNDAPDFLLTLDGKVIGYANLHGRHGERCGATEKEPFNAADIFEDILGDDFNISSDITALAKLRRELQGPKKEDYYVRQEVTISVYQKVSATSEKEALENATDLLAKVETFLDENFTDDGTSYVTSDYYTEVGK